VFAVRADAASQIQAIDSQATIDISCNHSHGRSMVAAWLTDGSSMDGPKVRNIRRKGPVFAVKV
jgi:hypothetical protein